MTELLLFCSTFVVVFALGFQQQNVIGRHYIAAFLTSFVIGLAYLSLYKLMPEASITQTLAYLAGGPFGIVASMYIHERTLGRKRRYGQSEGDAYIGKLRADLEQLEDAWRIGERTPPE